MSNKEISRPVKPYQELFNDIVKMVNEGKHRIATEFNSTVVILYWSIGKRINEEILKGDRANYGDQIISHVANELTTQFGKGYNRASIFRMVRFAKIYPNKKIVATVSRQLSWSHIVLICQMENELQRDFYIGVLRVNPRFFRFKRTSSL